MLEAMLSSAVLALKVRTEQSLWPRASAMNLAETLTSKYKLANAP
jgi:hypothetical protein